MQKSRIHIKQVERGNTEGGEVLAKRAGEMQKMTERERDWRFHQTEECIKKNR